MPTHTLTLTLTESEYTALLAQAALENSAPEKFALDGLRRLFPTDAKTDLSADERRPVTLRELHGIAPNATGDLASEEFVRHQRSRGDN